MQAVSINISVLLILVTIAAGFLFQSLDVGQRAFRDRDWVMAERAFREWTEKRPRDARGFRWLGMTYAAQEKMYWRCQTSKNPVN